MINSFVRDNFLPCSYSPAKLVCLTDDSRVSTFGMSFMNQLNKRFKVFFSRPPISFYSIFAFSWPK